MKIEINQRWLILLSKVLHNIAKDIEEVAYQDDPKMLKWIKQKHQIQKSEFDIPI